MDVTPAMVRLRLGELVLHGFPHGDRHRIADALRNELARCFAERGVPERIARGESPPELDAGAFEVPKGACAEEVGRRVAQALYRGLADGGA
jgi:hypothetical protein